jgi:hypothetical protein
MLHLARKRGYFMYMDMADGYYALGIGVEDTDSFTVNKCNASHASR